MQESAAHTASLFNLLLRLLQSFKLPVRGSDEDIDLRTKLGLLDNPKDAEFIATWLGKVILFVKPQAGIKRCPGLSEEDCKFLQLYGKDDVWMSSASGGLNLVETKIAAAKFLMSGAFVDLERFIPALFTSADSNSRISEIGDDILKRTSPNVSLEDRDLVIRLFSIYLGGEGADGTLPARMQLRIKILKLLCRSQEATTFVPQIIRVVEEGLQMSPSSVGGASASPVKQGLEASKLRSQVFAFINWVARAGTERSISAAAPYLVRELRNYIERQGWPQYYNDDSRAVSDELSSRAFGYESIGLMARACPDELLFENSLDLLRWLFESLSGDASGKDISISIEHALGSVLGAFSEGISDGFEASLTDLLLHYMTISLGDTTTSNSKVVRSTRFVAVRFANRCLSFHNTRARWIDLLAIEAGPNERNELIEEGRKGLDPYWFKTLNPPKNNSRNEDTGTEAAKYRLPDYGELIEEIFGSRLDGAQSSHGLGRSELSHAYGSAIVFCRCVLLHQALAWKQRSPIVDIDWKKNIDGLLLNDEEARKTVKDYLKETHKNDGGYNKTLTSYSNAAFSGLVDGAPADSDMSGECLLELCSLAPDFLLDDLSLRITDLRSSVFANGLTSRVIASHVFGLLASRKACPLSAVQTMSDAFRSKIALWDRAVGGEVHQVHGSILATSYLIGRLRYGEGIASKPLDHDLSFMNAILTILTSTRDKELLGSAIAAIDQLSLFSVFTPDTMPIPYKATSIVKKLKEHAKLGDEGAVLALGHFAMQCQEDTSSKSILNEIIDGLYSLHENKQPELHFAVGSALSCAAVAWGSKSLVGVLDVEGQPPYAARRQDTLNTMLRKVLGDCKTTKPALRQASVIWLLCLVQYCGHLEEVRVQLRSCQAAFKGFLADRDSLNQETASRGLTLVYEKGDRGLKDDLIRDLVRSFTRTSAGLAGNVSEDTELFEPGALPTGEGSVTTYKDIMNLAAEVGDPSLVYRFMSLASNNAIWSSRAAFGRFGLSNILSDSSVDGYLAQNPKIYPALYRYRFDPNTNVRSSMNEIWSALVKDSTATLNLHFDSIMHDLLQSILGKEWRVRQASCGAIADLVQGRPTDKYEKYLTHIWTKTFKVL